MVLQTMRHQADYHRNKSNYPRHGSLKES